MRYATRGIHRQAGFTLFVVDGFAVRVPDVRNHLRFYPHPAVGKHRVCPCHLKRRHGIGTECDGGRRLNAGVQSRTACHRYDRGEAHHLCHLYSRHVVRFRQRLPQSQRTEDLLVKINRPVGFVVENESRGSIVHGTRRSQNVLSALDPGIHGCRIDKWFEHRSRRPFRENPVQLAVGVIPSTDQSFDFASVRIERNQSGFRPRPPLVALRQHFVYFVHSGFDGFAGGALQIQVDRRINALGAVFRLIDRLQFIADQIEKIRGTQWIAASGGS